MTVRASSPVAKLGIGLLAVAAVAILAVQIRSRRDAKPPMAKSSAAARALRRAYDGAPPVIPHPAFGAACISCHKDQAMVVPEVGVSPPMPHGKTPDPGRFVRCRQCHVFRATDSVYSASDFVGLAQTFTPAHRLYPGAPPVIPHRTLLREDCASCHTGPTAREEIRCTHPVRLRCVQCHVPSVTRKPFAP